MSLRWPDRMSVSGSASPIEFEILSEKASALGRAGEQVGKALARLRSVDCESPDHRVRLKAAADAVYGYFIQRELCGLRRHHDAIREYGIPNEVLARLGVK